MKILGMLIVLLFSLPVQASCKCNCDDTDRSLCAPTYDLDHPCGGICSSQTPTMPPARTACPTQQVFIPAKGTTEWISICFD